MTVRMLVVAAVLLGLSSPASAQSAPVAEGDVVKVDLKAGRITIRHGPIADLAITAPVARNDFKVADGILFNALRPGDHVKFSAVRIKGELTLTGVYP